MILQQEKNMMVEALMTSSVTLASSWRPVSKQVGHDVMEGPLARILLICAD